MTTKFAIVQQLDAQLQVLLATEYKRGYDQRKNEEFHGYREAFTRGYDAAKEACKLHQRWRYNQGYEAAKRVADENYRQVVSHTYHAGKLAGAHEERERFLSMRNEFFTRFTRITAFVPPVQPPAPVCERCCGAGSFGVGSQSYPCGSCGGTGRAKTSEGREEQPATEVINPPEKVHATSLNCYQPVQVKWGGYRELEPKCEDRECELRAGHEPYCHHARKRNSDSKHADYTFGRLVHPFGSNPNDTSKWQRRSR